MMTEIAENVFRQALQLKPEQKVPGDLVAFYEQCKRKADCCTVGEFPVHTLILMTQIAMAQGASEATQLPFELPAENGAVPDVNWFDVPTGTPIDVTVGENVYQTGEFLTALDGKSKGQLRVKLDGDDKMFRIVPAEAVSLAKE